jgi:lipid II:glycine glycyltransferase (peptidoglycan interpeptide bridge formation enzyme)
MKFEFHIDDVSREQWEQHAKLFADYSIYQTWAYQQVRSDMEGQKVSRFIIKDENGRVATMGQVRIKHVRILGLKIGYIQWGPLVRTSSDTISCSIQLLRALRQAYVDSKVNVLRVVPNICADRIGSEFSKMLVESGFQLVRSVGPYHTMMFPLDMSEQDMRNRSHRSWRRYLNKAEINNIEIREGIDQEYFNVLEELYISALDRKKFKGLNPGEFVRTQTLLSPHEKMNIVVAYYESQPVTAHATSYLGDTALGILTASNEKGLRCSASYIVWWRTLLASKRAGMKKYDMGGIDPDNNPHVYQFKSRMGGQESFHIGIFEAYSSTHARVTWRMCERIYRYLKG